MVTCTIFKNVFDKKPYYIDLDKALERIKNGTSKDAILEIRKTLDKDRRNNLKSNLPSVCFSGVFEQRKDEAIKKHSGFICLDFDELADVEMKKIELKQYQFIYAIWVSPSGNGLKALVKIAKPDKHREHFQAIQEILPDIDKSGINVSRVCYESYDPEIIINTDAVKFTKVKAVTKEIEVKELTDTSEVFNNILKWLTNKGDAFVQGERNVFMFKLASACCRFGLMEHECYQNCANEFLVNDNSFTSSELQRVVKSAYKSSAKDFGTAHFEREELVSKITRQEVKIDADIYNTEIRPKDVIYGEDVKQEALNIYDNGFDLVNGIGVADLDTYFKLKRGEITLLTGIGNYGKSTFLKWYLLMRIIKFGEKFALFSPEDNPAQEFYHDLVEIYLGCNCTPSNEYRPSKHIYERTYDFISKHIFYVYPKEIAPTPDYVKERFLELIIKEKISGCIIDPFNQMANDYGKMGRSDKYLETFLSDCSRFAQLNSVYFLIVAHPHKLRKQDDGNYPCPDVFDVADGAMWNNKMDNIIVYHRPDHQNDPNSPLCELHTKKIRRQKTVGRKGVVSFELSRYTRRYLFDGTDVIADSLIPKQEEMKLSPNHDFDASDINDTTILDQAPF
jgi:hypothetical protein